MKVAVYSTRARVCDQLALVCCICTEDSVIEDFRHRTNPFWQRCRRAVVRRTPSTCHRVLSVLSSSRLVKISSYFDAKFLFLGVSCARMSQHLSHLDISKPRKAATTRLKRLQKSGLFRRPEKEKNKPGTALSFSLQRRYDRPLTRVSHTCSLALFSVVVGLPSIDPVVLLLGRPLARRGTLL